MVATRLGFRYKRNALFFYDCPRPEKKFYVRECDRSEWAKFRRYHYLNSDLPSAAKCYGLYDAEKIVAFIGVLHQPNKNPRIKRVTRLVVHPDYQGIGLGCKFLNFVAGLYVKENFDFSIVTSAKNLIRALQRDSHWIMIRYGANGCSSKKSAIDYNRKTIRQTCKTASFFYRR